MHKLNQANLSALQEVSLEGVGRETLGVDYNFSPIQNVLKDWHGVLLFISQDDGLGLPEQDVRNIDNWINEFLEIVSSIYSFQPKDQKDPTKVHTEIINKVRREYSSQKREWMRIETYIRVKELSKSTKVQEVRRQVEESAKIIASLKKDANEFKSNSKEAIAGVDRLVHDAKDFAAKTVTTDYAKLFSSEADKYKEKISYWWISIGVASAVEVGLAVVLFLVFRELLTQALDKEAYSVAVSLILLKVFVLSIGAAVLTQFIKHLNATNHLYSLYRYRAIALESFEVFLASTTDSKVSDALLVQIANSIYQNNVSGYLSKDDSTDNSHIAVLAQQIMNK